MSTSAFVLTLLISWTLLLLVLMEVVRSYLVVTGRSRSNEFKPDNSNLSPFMQRLARAHANCVESLPSSWKKAHARRPSNWSIFLRSKSNMNRHHGRHTHGLSRSCGDGGLVRDEAGALGLESCQPRST